MQPGYSKDALPGDAGGEGTDTPGLLDPSRSQGQCGAPQLSANMRGEAAAASGLQLDTENEASAEESKGRSELDPAASEAHLGRVFD